MSAAGIACLVLPKAVQRVRIFTDNDPDEKGLKAAHAARRRWESEGRAVVITRANAVGEDANDIWRRRAGL
jgi:hypothetical protein